MIPYIKQWQRITSAYLNDELNPLDNCACFIGNLLHGRTEWRNVICSLNGEHLKVMKYTSPNAYKAGVRCIRANSPYSVDQVGRLEHNFLKIIAERTFAKNTAKLVEYDSDQLHLLGKNYEIALYEAMVSTLELLRQIHIKLGDTTAIDFGTTLQKRSLKTA